MSHPTPDDFSIFRHFNSEVISLLLAELVPSQFTPGPEIWESYAALFNGARAEPTRRTITRHLRRLGADAENEEKADVHKPIEFREQESDHEFRQKFGQPVFAYRMRQENIRDAAKIALQTALDMNSSMHSILGSSGCNVNEDPTCGLPVRRMYLLYQISNGITKSTDLFHTLDTTYPSFYQSIDGLVEAGLLQRNPVNRRETRYLPSAAGCKLFEDFLMPVLCLANGWDTRYSLKEMTDHGRRHLIDLYKQSQSFYTKQSPQARMECIIIYLEQGSATPLQMTKDLGFRTNNYVRELLESGRLSCERKNGGAYYSSNGNTSI
ncbi:hypothetical protein JW968_01620 [Candidatus Woesearchaeota archaeon]|nr:hypothetical protein [Candidatus Woesearchaeota archaeon]